VAGLVKAVLAVQRGRIPANLGFAEPNPHIPFEQLGLQVVGEPLGWPVTGRPRRAGVSSFGFGGTNAHVVLEQGPEPVALPEVAEPVVSTLVVSGKSAQRVAATAAVLAEWMDGAGAEVGLAQVAHGLNHHRARYPVFATVAARDRREAVAGLAALAAGRSAPGVVGPHAGSCRAGTVFVYSGQGSQWPGMGRRLLADEPAFAAAVAELEPVFVEVAGFSLQRVLAGGESVAGIERIQPVLVGVQLALTALWRSYGIEPDAVIGHSMGEVSAAVVAGALSPRDGLRVITTRSRLMARLSGQGAMALLELDPDGAAELIAEHPDLTLAVYASPRQTVIAGPPEQVDAVIATVAAQDRLARRIEVDVASHHPIIDPVLPELRSALADLAPRRPGIPIITTTGETPTFDADHWAANLRNPVRFTQAVAEAGAEHGTFVEVSPHPVLTYAISDTLADVHHHSLGTLARDTHDTLTFHTNLNAAHTAAPPRTEHPGGPAPVLPTTPWHHTRHWVTATQRAASGGSAPAPGTLLGARTDVAATAACLWQANLAPEVKPYPGCHRLHGVDVVPLSVLLQTLTAAAREAGAAAVSDVRFEHPIVVDRPRAIQVLAADGSVTVSSRAGSDAPWIRHAGGRLAPCAPDGDHPAPAATGEAETRSITELFEEWGVEGQPFPWSIDALRHTPGGAVADLALAGPAEPSVVALLDAAVHAARLVDRDNPRLLVPSGVGSAWLASTCADRRAVAELRRLPGDAGEVVVDLVVRTPDGAVCADVRALRYTDVESGAAQAAAPDSDPASASHAIDWGPWRADGEQAGAAPGPLAVVGGDGADTAGLAGRLADAGYTPAGIAEARYVVYLAGPAADDADVDGAARLTSQVAELVGELAGRDDHAPVTLWIVTRGVREADSGEARRHSGLWGLAGVIGAEHPELWGGLVDIAAGDDLGACAARLPEVLPHAAKQILALRDSAFLCPTMCPIAGEPVREPLRCRPDAAYLITGGMGALGLLMADWLADRGARRLVLAGRTPLPPRRDWDGADDPAAQHKITAIRALERRGVSVEAVALDVGSPEAVRELLDRRDRAGAPPIRGIIHAAGITENRLLTETAQDTLRRVMWPKIAGAQALHRAFPPGRLDFFFLTASAGTVFGVPGQGAYAAANAYLDCLARSRSRQGCHTVSLDWVAWEGLGFAADAAITIGELERLGSRPLRPAEAFAAWEYVSAHDIAQAVIAPMTPAETDGESPPAPAAAWSQLSGDDLLRELETALRAVLARELRLPEAELEPDRPFAELGLNSVMAMSIRREVERVAGMELSATMLWNHPTIASLSAFLAKKVAPQTDSTERTEETAAPADGVLDALFDSVESA
uniref:type I polyketide synthase n=1 Tax=Mycobacterium sp. HUMS_1102779 TaxID=3383487 RepID=UPI003899CD10